MALLHFFGIHGNLSWKHKTGLEQISICPLTAIKPLDFNQLFYIELFCLSVLFAKYD